MKSPIPKFALIIILVIVGFFGYRFFVASPESEPAGLVGLSPAGMVDPNNRAASDEFLTLLSSLNAIDLSDLPRVLTLMSGLEDFSTELEPQLPGRANPFAPIGEGGGLEVEPVATTTATSTATAN